MSVKIQKSDLNKKYPLMTNGGESEIFEYENSLLLKIFKDNVLLDLKEQKVRYWLKKKALPFIVAPLDYVTIFNKFAGYVLEKIDNASPIGSLAKKKYIKLNGYNNKDILEIVLDYSKKLELIHKDGKYIGDINDGNVLMKGKELYYIDVDSFGIDVLPADAFTEIYTDPTAYRYKGNTLIKVELSEKTDMFAFAVLAFRLLTRMHPFNGGYEKDINMNTETRIKKRISVLGPHNVQIPPMIDSWNWLSPKLLKAFLDIFENGKRQYITNELEDLLNNLKYCNKHNLYYYSKYTECPICNENAKISIMPNVTNAKSHSRVTIKTVFTSKDINYIFDFSKYLTHDFKFVQIGRGNTWKASNNYRVEFSEDGKFVFEIYDNEILVYGVITQKYMYKILKSYKSQVYVTGKYLYYIDESGKLCRSIIKKEGNFCEEINCVYINNIYVANNEDYLVILLYDGKMLIDSKDFNVFLKYNDKISEYAIKFDKATKNWLFIYETRNGSHRTVVISNKGEILFDDTIYRYTVSSLSNICFVNNTIFSPSHGKIVGINYKENRVKNFDCHVVTEESVINFQNGGFDIITSNTIYRYGV